MEPLQQLVFMVSHLVNHWMIFIIPALPADRKRDDAGELIFPAPVAVAEALLAQEKGKRIQKKHRKFKTILITKRRL